MIPVWLFDAYNGSSFCFHVVELLFSDDMRNGTMVVFGLFFLIECDVEMSGQLIGNISAQVLGLHFVSLFFYWVLFLVLLFSGIFFCRLDLV